MSSRCGLFAFMRNNNLLLAQFRVKIQTLLKKNFTLKFTLCKTVTFCNPLSPSIKFAPTK